MAESAAGDTSLRARRVQQQAAAAPAAPKPDAKAEGTEAGGVEGFVTFEMTPEAEAEHEWWIYWFCFVGASLLGVMCMALAFCSAALSPVRCPPPTDRAPQLTATPQSLAAAILPSGGFLSFVVTMTACCRIHSRHARFQPGVTIPVISELGIMQPGKIVYQVGFALVGLLLAASMQRFDATVVPLLLDAVPAGAARAKAARDLAFAVKAGYASAAGAGLQGIFTLELQMSSTTMIHFAAAMAFMAGGMQHAEAAAAVYGVAAAPDGGPCLLLSHPPVATAVAFRAPPLHHASFMQVLAR